MKDASQKRILSHVTKVSLISFIHTRHWLVYLINIGQPVSVRAAKDLLSPHQASRSGARIPSCHMRELSRGHFLIKSEDVVLLDSIGEGVCVCALLVHCTWSWRTYFPYTGEFGIVYRARIGLSKRQVAVKTLKGDLRNLTVYRMKWLN